MDLCVFLPLANEDLRQLMLLIKKQHIPWSDLCELIQCWLPW